LVGALGTPLLKTAGKLIRMQVSRFSTRLSLPKQSAKFTFGYEFDSRPVPSIAKTFMKLRSARSAAEIVSHRPSPQLQIEPQQTSRQPSNLPIRQPKRELRLSNHDFRYFLASEPSQKRRFLVLH
jgi:hypothetical protein